MRTSGVDPDAATGGFEAFFDAHYAEVVRALALATGDRARAEDAAQEAFATALRRWADVAAMDRPVGWVLVVATNRVRRWLSRTERRLVPVAEPVAPGTPAPDGGPDGHVAHDVDLRAALDRLPPRQRATVVLRHLCDLSTAEVAEALGCAEGTVKSALHAGLAALRVDLGEDGDGPSGADGPTDDREVDDGHR